MLAHHAQCVEETLAVPCILRTVSSGSLRADKGTHQGVHRWFLESHPPLAALAPRLPSTFCCANNKVNASRQKGSGVGWGLLYEHVCTCRDLLANNPSPKMFVPSSHLHTQSSTSKCLLSINIFIHSPLLLPLVISPDSEHSECQETPLTQSQQGIGFGKGHFQVPAGSQQLSLTASRDLAPSSRLLAWRLFP